MLCYTVPTKAGEKKIKTMNNFNGTFDPHGKVYKHIFFDMDNTLTPSRALIEQDMKEALTRLCENFDVAIVSGGEETRMWKQMTEHFRGRLSFLVQNGNNAYSHKEAKYLWDRKLSTEEKKEILEHIWAIEREYSDLIERVRKDEKEKLIEDRGCQISFSFVGHNASHADKKAFDPDGSIRQGVLEKVPLLSENIEVKLGGSTCFDYNQKGKNKGSNILLWLKHFGWSVEDSLYVGDALFPGGNDDTVLGVCDTLQVGSPAETLAAIRKMI